MQLWKGKDFPGRPQTFHGEDLAAPEEAGKSCLKSEEDASIGLDRSVVWHAVPKLWRYVILTSPSLLLCPFFGQVIPTSSMQKPTYWPIDGSKELGFFYMSLLPYHDHLDFCSWDMVLSCQNIDQKTLMYIFEWVRLWHSLMLIHYWITGWKTSNWVIQCRFWICSVFNQPTRNRTTCNKDTGSFDTG